METMKDRELAQCVETRTQVIHAMRMFYKEIGRPDHVPMITREFAAEFHIDPDSEVGKLLAVFSAYLEKRNGA
jgi:hypothetical protein